jgi:hypothetical protein
METCQFKNIISCKKKRDPDCEIITPQNIVEKTSFLRGFSNWLVSCGREGSGSKHCISKETMHCAKQTCEAIASLSEYLIHEKNFKIFLPGKCQSDKIEGRFGKYRQMNGGNLYASVRQILEAERTIRVKNLVKLNLELSKIR